MYPDPSRLVFGPKILTYLESDMANYISQKGILPMLIPDLQERYLTPILEEMDAFVFQGGTDLSPASYGEEPIIPGKWPGDPYRDAYELKLMEYAFQAEKPVLGICRGFQLLNVFLGGSLYQDIAYQRPDAIKHRDAEAYDSLRHEVEITSDSFLKRIYGVDGEEGTPKIVNSVHHQGVKVLGKDLNVLAVCKEDGIIEAIGYKLAPEGKVFGVQWHPEFAYQKHQDELDSKKLIEFFLTHVKK